MKRDIFKILLVAFVLRVLLLIIDQFCFRLPQGGADTEMFDNNAYRMVKYGEFISFSNVISSGSTLFTYLGFAIYTLFGRHPFLWAFLMLLFGVASIYNIYQGALIISGNHLWAKRSAWVACWFPNFAVLSVFVSREALIYYFASLSALHFLRFVKQKKIQNFLYFIVYGIITSLWHPAMLAVLFGGFLYLAIFDKVSILLRTVILIVAIISVYYINATHLGLAKFGGSIESAIDIVSSTGVKVKEGANTNYPEWLTFNGNTIRNFLVLTPIRMIAFLFAPLFPFFVKQPSHLLGALDGFLYLALFFYMFRNRKILSSANGGKAAFFIIVITVFAFSLGAGNFGTNIRHRAKLLPIILMLSPIILKKDYLKP